MTLFDRPWPHAVVDDLISDDFLKILTEYSRSASADNRYGLHFFNKPETFTTDIQKQYQIYHDNLLKRKQEFLDLFPQQKNFKELDLEAHLAVQRGNYEYHPHCDHPKKIITIVTYIDNDAQQGTRLHDREHGPVVKTVDWKPGRSIIFASLNDVTWHSYGSGGSPRAAICAFFIEKGHAVT